MSFLKEFKEDLSQAVNELVEEKVVDKEEAEAVAIEEASEVAEEIADDEMINTIDEEEFTLDIDELDAMLDEVAEEASEEVVEEVVEEPSVEAIEEVIEEPVEEVVDTVEEKFGNDNDSDIPSDEVAEITKGTSIVGNIESDGSVNVYGKIKGDITCKGKLMVTGRVVGTSNAKEIFANNAKIEGDVHSDGTIKVGNGSVIVGNVYATSAVIGGAIKGDIDVKGPVIVDGTAVIQGNIKSRSVQINNGAAIEGFCSQCYADIDYKSLFEDTFSIG